MQVPIPTRPFERIETSGLANPKFSAYHNFYPPPHDWLSIGILFYESKC